MSYDDSEKLIAKADIGYEEMTDCLYNLDRRSLRRLAYEALLISDGPDRVEDEADVEPFTDEDSPVKVERQEPYESCHLTFMIWDIDQPR